MSQSQKTEGKVFMVIPSDGTREPISVVEEELNINTEETPEVKEVKKK
jgi:hypothetical protein